MEILITIRSILNLLVPLIVSLGVVFFVWSVVQYVIAGGEEAKKTGRDRIIYGIIALVVIVGLWGLVNIVMNTFGLGGASAPASDKLGACTVNLNSFRELVYYARCTINNSLIPLLFAVALLIFIWGVVKFLIVNADEEAKRSQGKQFIIWGLIGLTVMVAVWGLVRIVGGSLGFNTTVIPELKN